MSASSGVEIIAEKLVEVSGTGNRSAVLDGSSRRRSGSTAACARMSNNSIEMAVSVRLPEIGKLVTVELPSDGVSIQHHADPVRAVHRERPQQRVFTIIVDVADVLMLHQKPHGLA